MLLFRYLCISLLCVSIVAGSQDVFAAASGAGRLELPDAATVGKGSAFVGEANRPSAIYYNPAGITQVARAVSFGVTALQTRLDVKLPNDDKLQMRRDTFVFPHVYFVTPLVEDKFYLGLGESSNYGAGNNWAADSTSSFTRYSMVHSELEHKNLMFVGAYKLNDQFSFGVGIDNDDAKLEKQKKLYQGAGADGNSQLKTKDNAWGYRLSTLYKVNEKHQFGLMYRSRINHKYEGKLYFDGLNNTTPIFGADGGYSDVFGGSSFETKATYKVTLPQSVVLGYSFKPSNKWTFNIDIEWLDWSSRERARLDFPDVSNAAQNSVLNINNPQSQDWKSVWSQSLGFEYAANDRLRLRGGYAHHQTPIGNETFETTFPDSNSHSFTTGLGYDLNSKLTLDLAYVADFYETRKVGNSVDTAFGASMNGKYKQFINVGMVTLTYKF